MNLDRRRLLAGAAALSVAGPPTVDHFPDTAALTALIKARVDEGGARGLVLGVREADGRRRIVAYGDPGQGAPLGPKAVVEIGSITKVFTAILLSEMAGRGEVDISAPAQTYAPAGLVLPTRNGRSITLEDLATHRSGLPRLPGNMPEADPLNAYADYTPAHLKAFLASYQLPRGPGATYEYSNLGVGLLGYILAARSGGDYAAVVQRRILRPLGMTMTGVGLTRAMRANLAEKHGADGRPVPLWDMPTLQGMGALRSTMDDMLTFLAANLRKPTTALDRAIRETHRLREQRGSAGTGLAWRINLRGQDRALFHDGGTMGFSTMIAFDPDRKVSAAIFSNSTKAANDLVVSLINPAASRAG